MTFNRYMFLRMMIELVGAVACLAPVLLGNALAGVVATGVIALLWVIGEVWVTTILRRKDPRRDELSDEHQKQGMQFAFIVTLAALIALGFVGTVVSLAMRNPIHIPPMSLPALAMAALALGDARYLWLEHAGMQEDSDED